MDPADTDSVQKVISSQGNLLGQHHQLLQGLMETQQSMGNQVTHIGRMIETIANPRNPLFLRQSPTPESSENVRVFSFSVPLCSTGSHEPMPHIQVRSLIWWGYWGAELWNGQRHCWKLQVPFPYLLQDFWRNYERFLRILSVLMILSSSES